MSFIKRAAGPVALMLIGSAAWGQSDTPWDGFYLGLNAGSASNNTCDSWSSTGSGGSGVSLRGCPGGGFVGGAQFGENFQRGRLVYGLGLDFDAWLAKSDNRTLAYSGTAAPAGTYATLGRLTPDALIIIAPRIGYGGKSWFPYVRGGALIDTGAHEDGLGYTPAGSTKPIVNFSGNRNYETTGWVAGAGVEIGLHGAFSFSAEVLHADLGKGGSSAASCAPTPKSPATACAAFSGIDLVSTHGDFTANIFRIGISYYFQYWNP